MFIVAAIINVLFAVKIIWFHWYASTKWGWFKDDHLKVPKWIGFACGVAGLFIPITPLAMEGMLVGYVVYFGNEWVYQKTRWSPLRDTFKWAGDRIRTVRAWFRKQPSNR